MERPLVKTLQLTGFRRIVSSWRFKLLIYIFEIVERSFNWKLHSALISCGLFGVCGDKTERWGAKKARHVDTINTFSIQFSIVPGHKKLQQFVSCLTIFGQLLDGSCGAHVVSAVVCYSPVPMYFLLIRLLQTYCSHGALNALLRSRGSTQHSSPTTTPPDDSLPLRDGRICKEYEASSLIPSYVRH